MAFDESTGSCKPAEEVPGSDLNKLMIMHHCDRCRAARTLIRRKSSCTLGRLDSSVTLCNTLIVNIFLDIYKALSSLVRKVLIPEQHIAILLCLT